MPNTHEKEIAPIVTILGTLGDFKLGNKENGIPSELAEAGEVERQLYGEKLVESLKKVTDLCHYGCIDGRVCMHNADGSNPEIRRRQVGGTGLLVEVALNSDASVLDTVEDPNDLGQVVSVVESMYETQTGIRRSAHLGGCGGVKGAVADNETIASKPEIMAAVEAVMSIPAVLNYTNTPFDPEAAASVVVRAGQTADWMKDKGWNGDDYVAGVEADEPAGVEDLEVGHDVHHGHREPAVVFILNTGEEKYSLSDEEMKKFGVTPPFVVHLDASFEMAEAFAGQQGEIGRTKAFIANLAKHMGVADRLPSDKTPVYLIVI